MQPGTLGSPQELIAGRTLRDTTDGGKGVGRRMNMIHPGALGTLSQALLARYRTVRARTEALAAPLSPEDQVAQSMPDASPVKWHRAHTTWFFETFLLKPLFPGYRPLRDEYAFLFNSYYEAAGPRLARPQRGILTRPFCAEVGEYRAAVDAAMTALLRDPPDQAQILVELGLQHEEQHQELLLTDILHALSLNPLRPAYDPAAHVARRDHDVGGRAQPVV